MRVKYKKTVGVVISILLHLLLLLFAMRILDQDRVQQLQQQYRPTSTRGYTVDLINQQSKTAPVSPLQQPNSNTAMPQSPTGNPNKVSDIKRDINFKDNSAELAKQAALKAAAAKAARQKVKERRAKAQDMARRKAQTKAAAAGTAHMGNNTLSATPTMSRHREQIEPMPKKEIILQASAPIIDDTKPGSGDQMDSSTNGNGTASGVFDVRVIEYGRQAAYAINQNIIVPNQYKYARVTYRAFVSLDRDMSFQGMQMIQSTGSPEFDENIARALRQTVYPPLPPGADWNRYHNIDFTIGKNN